MRFYGTVVVLASGPSLTQEDVDKTAYLPCIAVNSTWKIARHSAVLFAGDITWWVNEAESVDIPAKRVSLSYDAEREFDAERFVSKIWKRNDYNSGCIAIEYAVVHGADRVLMLGFDCSVKNGIHHHGRHARSKNPNPAKCEIWKAHFRRLRDTYPAANIVNCSHYTELDIFPLVPLDDALCGLGLTSAIPYPSVRGHFQPD